MLGGELKTTSGVEFCEKPVACESDGVIWQTITSPFAYEEFCRVLELESAIGMLFLNHW